MDNKEIEQRSLKAMRSARKEAKKLAQTVPTRSRVMSWLRDYEAEKNLETKKDTEIEKMEKLETPVDDRKSASCVGSGGENVMCVAQLREDILTTELEAQATVLKMKQDVEEKEFRLTQEHDERAFRLKLQKEEIILETKLRTAKAKAKLFKKYRDMGDLNESYIDYVVEKVPDSVRPKEPAVPKAKDMKDKVVLTKEHEKFEVDGDSVDSHYGSSEVEEFVHGIQAVLEKQNDITQSLLKQTLSSSLPAKTIPLFSGDPLEYHLFIRAFEHGVEDKTESDRDRLYYLEQHTGGDAREIVRSCLHMDASSGYRKAKDLLKRNFGNEYRIATSFVEQALKWTPDPIPAEDAKSLKKFSLYLQGCANTLKGMKYNELDHPTNLKKLAQKLPYKLRSSWRTEHYRISQKRCVEFTDFVEFVTLHADILNDPIVGDIVDTRSANFKGNKKNTRVKGSYATNVQDSGLVGKRDIPSSVDTGHSNLNPRVKPFHQGRNNTVFTPSADSSECVFCNRRNHATEHCRQLKSKSHEEKIQFLKSKGLCFSCLQHGHMGKFCTRKLSCQVCSRVHPTVLHQDNTNRGSDRSVPVVNGFATDSRSDHALSIVPVVVKAGNGDKCIRTYAFLDTGSTASFCTEKLMRSLNVEGKRVKINLCTMSDKSKPASSYLVKGLEVGSLDGGPLVKLPDLYTQSQMPVTRRDIPTQQDISTWPHLSKVIVPNIDSDIDLLIGTNAPKAIEPWEVINCEGEGPYAVRTVLGWSINGPLKNSGECSDVLVNRTSVLSCSQKDNLEQQLKFSFNMDFSERAVDDEPEYSVEDKLFLKKVSDSAKLKDNHYEIGLPFKHDTVEMPNNRKMAEQRVFLLQKRFQRSPEFQKEYSAFMDNVLSKGYAREVPADQLHGKEGQKWYLPHHGVYHPTKKKLRVVFDCGASYGGTSLNEQLLQGPNLTNSLVGVLLRFRQDNVAAMGDIESMFYQVRVPDEDASFLRFLWWENGDTSKPLKEYQMVVHIFGASSSPSCANFALRKTAEDNSQSFPAEVAESVLNSCYVDDYIKNFDSDETAIPMVADVKELCSKGGFRLTKWVSNSRAVIDSVGQNDLAVKFKDLDLQKDSLPIEKALGVQWNPETDKLGFRTMEKEKPTTRRGVLSITSSLYDPLGFLSPFILKARLIVQELCRQKLGWDEDIPEQQLTEWQDWLSDLTKITDFEVDRCVKPVDFGEIKSAELCHFSDASGSGYGVVSYLRLVNHADRIHCALIISKSRVAPLKTVTIPRMELTAATVAVRVDHMLRKELEIPIANSSFWTDSTSVLKYIRNKGCRFKTFVANRLQIIHEGSDPAQWFYIDSKSNPADIASRGETADGLLQNETWVNGPSFLWKPKEAWPTYPDVQDGSPLTEKDPEVKCMHTDVELGKPDNSDDGVATVEKLLRHHSSWHKLKVSVSWILRVKNELLRRVRAKRGVTDGIEASDARKPLSVKDLRKAEKAILSFVQQQHFSEEINALESKGRVRKSSKLVKLDPVIEDNLLRLGGRLSLSAIPEHAKHPIVLPRNSFVTTLIIREKDKNIGHSGRNHVLSSLRQKYWILHAHSAIRNVIRKCTDCRRQNAKLGEQKMANLPSDRLIPEDGVFSHCGVDYFGPIEVKRGRALVKRYGVLFTCLKVRAVHIEVAESLDTDSCINAIRRFIARRGQVKRMRSDNGTNLVAAERELRESVRNLDHDKIRNTLLCHNIDWDFGPPTGAHHGGVWEIKVKSAKKVLRSVIKQQVLNDEGLRTVLCEVEAILNGCPLTIASDDPMDLEPLTPNHLLLLRGKPSLPPGTFSKDDMYSKRRWRQVQYISDLFWKRWVREYLPQLQERQKWLFPKRNLKVGDIVIIADESAPRNAWPLARITEVYPDRWGYVRRVKVMTKTGNELERPITKLCLLVENED